MAKGADGELGVAEEGGVVGSDEGACHVEDVVVAGLGDGLSQLLGLCLLSVRERFLHGHFSDIRGGFFSKTLRQGLVYKNSTNFRDAHTVQESRPRKAGSGPRSKYNLRWSTNSALNT